MRTLIALCLLLSACAPEKKSEADQKSLQPVPVVAEPTEALEQLIQANPGVYGCTQANWDPESTERHLFSDGVLHQFVWYDCGTHEGKHCIYYEQFFNQTLTDVVCE